MSLPGGVFQPYSGVKTSVLFFRKGGKTENVLFLHADNDGYKLDANHDQAIEVDDLPVLIVAYRDRAAGLKAWDKRDPKAEWTVQWWFADEATLRAFATISLPSTFLIDPSGVVRARWFGATCERELQAAILPILEAREAP